MTPTHETRVVPLEPMHSQLDRALHDMGCKNPKESKQWLREFYRAMLAAAPAAPRYVDDALRAAAISGWNACRRSVYAVCEDAGEEYGKHVEDTENEARHHFGRGGAYLAKSIARGFCAMEAEDDDNFTQAMSDLAASPDVAPAAPAPEPVATVISEWDDTSLVRNESRKAIPVGTKLYTTPPAPVAATQITMGSGLVDVTDIQHEGRKGILFRPRTAHLPVGAAGELPAGEYWPIAGDVVIWIESSEGAQVIQQYLAPFLPAPVAASAVDDPDEAYKLGKDDGYNEAVQQIDRLTGGDGEYRYCTDHDPDRHTPDPATMTQRIVARFALATPSSDDSKAVRVRARLETGDAWRTIESAEEGIEALVTGYSYNDPKRGRYYAVATHMNGGWYDEEGSDLHAPTHYLLLDALPPPPAAEEG